MKKYLLIYICKYLLLLKSNNIDKYLLISKDFNEAMVYNLKKKIACFYLISNTNKDIIKNYFIIFNKYFFIKLSCSNPFKNYNEYGYFSIIKKIECINETIIAMKKKIKNIFSPILTIGIINIKYNTINIIYFKRNFDIPDNNYFFNNIPMKFSYIWYYQVKKFKNEIKELNI
jgi:hypothetical protein